MGRTCPLGRVHRVVLVIRRQVRCGIVFGRTARYSAGRVVAALDELVVGRRLGRLDGRPCICSCIRSTMRRRLCDADGLLLPIGRMPRILRCPRVRLAVIILRRLWIIYHAPAALSGPMRGLRHMRGVRVLLGRVCSRVVPRGQYIASERAVVSLRM